MTDELWTDAELRAFLKVGSARHFQRVKKRFPSVRIQTATGVLVRYDPEDVKFLLEQWKTARPRATHIPRLPRSLRRMA